MSQKFEKRCTLGSTATQVQPQASGTTVFTGTRGCGGVLHPRGHHFALRMPGAGFSHILPGFPVAEASARRKLAMPAAGGPESGRRAMHCQWQSGTGSVALPLQVPALYSCK
jgi:hypothetical protein